MFGKCNDIKKINHACVKFQVEGKIIYTDPFDVGTDYNDADIIFITHAHGDHFSVIDIKKLVKSSTKFVVPKFVKNANPANINMAEQIKEELSIENNRIVEVSQKGHYTVDNIKFETIPSYNKNHPKENGWVGYTIVLKEKRYHIPSDTGLTEELTELNTDVLLLPVDGIYNLSPDEAAGVIKSMKKKPFLAIPYHYGNPKFDSMANSDTTQNGEKFKEEVRRIPENSCVEVVII